MTIEQRLNRLERQNRRLKLGGMFLLLGFGAVFLMGQAEGVPKEVIRAKNFVVVDDNGRMLARLGPIIAGGTNPVLQLWSESGKAVVNLRASGNRPSLSLTSDTGSTVSLGTTPYRAAVEVQGPGEGVPRAEARMVAIAESVRIDLGIVTEDSISKGDHPANSHPGVNLEAGRRDGASVALTDESGLKRATLGVENLINPKTGVQTRRPENSLVLFNAEGTVVHEVP